MSRTGRLRLLAIRMTAIVIIPLLVLVILETGLCIFGFGYPTDFFKKIEGQNAYTGNTCFGWRFFPRSLARVPVMFHMAGEKKPGTYRIFVLGGSACITPAPEYGFARVLEVMLRERYPQTRFEVVITAMTAINSHVVRCIAEDCARHEPDLLIVYLGNNEVIGPFGAGTVFGGFLPNRFAIRSGLMLKSTALGQLIESIVRSIGGKRDRFGEWKGMEMFLGNRLPADDVRLQRIYDSLRGNLEDICKAGNGAGAGVLVCTMGVNLKDCAPFASMHRPDLEKIDKAGWDTLYQKGIALEEQGHHSQAAQLFAAASQIDDRHAELHFRLARCEYAMGRYGKALEHYELARDLDVLRFRADSRINETIRRVASGRERENVFFLDAAKVFEECDATPHGVPGEELFFEHVHLRYAGNYTLARAIFERLQEILPESVKGSAPSRNSEPASMERCAEMLALTGYNRYWINRTVYELISEPPFTNRANQDEQLRKAFREFDTLKKNDSRTGHDEAATVYRKAISLAGDDIMLRNNYGLLQLARHRYNDALENWEFIRSRLPEDPYVEIRIGTTLALMGRKTRARASFDRILELTFHSVKSYNDIANSLAQLEFIPRAISYYRRALKIDPDNSVTHSNLGRALARAGRFEEAIEEYLEADRLSPGQRPVLKNIGLAYFESGKYREAAEYFTRVIEINPYDVLACDRLAQCLAGQGKLDEACRWFAAAARIRPDDPQIVANYAYALEQARRFTEAKEQYLRLLDLGDASPQSLTMFAWMLATCSHDEVRDPALAIELARSASDTLGGEVVEPLDALAAAYASDGQFLRAVEIAERAEQFSTRAGNQELAGEIRRRIELYRSEKPYREP